MVTLIGKKTSKKFLEIQEKLDNFSVSYQMKYTSDTPYLTDGEKEFKGDKKINAYLEELEQELKQWYYCL
ncbi:hypothetical protein N9B82_05345 [Saprospiraceae bacterium]|nr:hypothetical protein [Saprospiraceae bacterium]